MDYVNVNRSIKVHLYCILRLSVDKRQILLDTFT